MGRHKTTSKHLPQRMRRKGRNYYYVAQSRWTPLGDDYVKALAQWRDLEGVAEGAETIAKMLTNALAIMVGDLKPGTFKEFSRACTNLSVVFKDFTPADVEPYHIARYLEMRPRYMRPNEKPLTGPSKPAKVAANREVAFLSSAWEVARRLGWIKLPNPCIGIKRNKEKKRKRTAKHGEIYNLLHDNLGNPRDCMQADMVELAFLTGMRESDEINLTKQQLERDGIRVKPRKTDESTEVEQIFEWTPELRAVIDRALARRRRVGSIFIFGVTRGKRAGQPYTVNSFQSFYHRYFAKCGVVGLTWHDVRRTALNEKRRAEGKEAAQEMGAHSSMATTEGYLQGVGEVRVKPISLAYMRISPKYEKNQTR